MACTDERSVDIYQSLRCNNQVVFEFVLTEYVNLMLMKKLYGKSFFERMLHTNKEGKLSYTSAK